MRSIDEIPVSELKGKRVFLRTSLNLPVAADGSVSDIFRLKRAVSTIQYLVAAGAKIIIVGYLGRKGDSMRPVAEALQKLEPTIPFRFFGTPFEHAREEVAELKESECLILESTRRDPGEESNDPDFTKLLASLADIFVGDALAEAHREYASNVGVAKIIPAYAGLLMKEEVGILSEARTPAAPSFAILGGAKFETKAPLVKALLGAYDKLFLTGALANDVFKARNLPVGRSLISKELPDTAVLENTRFLAPIDVTAEDSAGHARIKKPEAVIEDDKIVDIGPDSVAMLAPLIAEAKFILWNGPTGLYENGYVSYTQQIAELVAHAHERGARVVIGGGDTIAAIEAAGVAQERLGFLSTGGGAMLEYLLKGTLPGIEVLSGKK